ncbi:MAG: sugar-binding protein [Lachnospiraceae bacterium]|nr:sugar-binding protein [Lachnospiraceae bacterium]
MKKALCLLLCLAMVVSMLTACGSSSSGNKVGVSMPTKSLQRWNQDGSNMKEQLEKKGYEVDLQFADGTADNQVNQLENMISNGCKVLVIASIDGNSLGTVLATAKEKGVKVIAYDRLIMNTDAVTYYATFDNFMVGVKQGQYIEDQLGLKSNAGPFNIELIAGSPDDNNAHIFFEGAMSVLKKYIDNGTLVVKSGQTSFEQVATQDWKTDNAQSRFEALIASNYADGTQLDAVMASNDSTALGVANALANSYNGKYPILTGQDCDIANVKNMINGKQSMSIFKDTRDLAAKTTEMVDAILKGGEPPINNTTDYDNGKFIVPSYLCEPVFADVNNYEKLLVESGYYKAEELK